MNQQLNSAPVGIDLGSYKSKIGVAKRGGVEVIINEANFRETPCIVGYGPNQRQIGQSGFIKMKSNFRDSVVAPQRFLGLDSSYPMIRAETKYCPARSSFKDNKIQFQVNYQGQKQALVPEQIMAAYFNKMKFTVMKNGFEDKEAVIAVPPYLTQSQRKAYLNAAKIAELNVTRLINDSTAIALDYGMFRKADLDAQNARNVLFIDFGHSKFSVFCCSFTKEQMNVLYQDFHRNIGCRDLDYMMYQFYRGVFEKSSGGCDLSENRKAVVKLMENLERQRKILSGNLQYEMSIQYLMQENDLHYSMKRAEFEKISEPLFHLINEVLIKARQTIKQKGINLHSVELVGGGTRIPEFLRIAKETLGFQLSRTLNSSQSVARGCALMAAIKSPLFKVPQYILNEKVFYGVKFCWNFVEGNNFLGMNSDLYPQKQRKMIFDQGSKVPSSKTIKFTRKQAIQILIQYDPTVVGFQKHIGYFVTKPQNPKQQTFGVTFKLKHNENGIVSFEDCSLVEEWTEQTKIPKKKQVKKEEKKDSKDEEKKPESEEKVPEEQFEIKKTKKEKFTQIKFDANYFNAYNEKQVHEFFTVQSTMCNQDRIIIETYQRKNELQSLIYSWKEKVNGSHKDYAKPEEVPPILSFLEAMNEWLYGDGQESNRGVYINKINEVKEKVSAIQKRYDTFENIRNQIADLIGSLKMNFDFLNSLDKKYEHITPEERQDPLNGIQAIKIWLQNAEQAQGAKPKYQDPVISVADLKNKNKQITESTKKVMSKPAPKPEVPKKEENPSKPAESTKMQDEGEKKDESKIDEEK